MEENWNKGLELLHNMSCQPHSNTLSVKQLIEQLNKIDGDLPVYISNVGITENSSWDSPLEFGEDTVTTQEGVCRIHSSNM